MTIYFKGHDFKYEIESIVKLFFPVERFELVYLNKDEEKNSAGGDYVYTELISDNKVTNIVEISYSSIIYRSERIIDVNEKELNKEIERMFCEQIYLILSKLLNVKPKWGILTGVRPVNIIKRKRVEGNTDKEIYSWLKEKYLVSDEKLKLAFLTADVQKPFFDMLDDSSYSLYIGIPFCKSRCSYCSFVSHAITMKSSMDKVDDYVDCLVKELEETAKITQELKLRLNTIYIGGGTPTAIEAAQLKRITDAVSEYFPIEEACEYTIEAGRADTITYEKLEVIKNSGANRISINPQTFNDEVLKVIGRKHTAQDVEDCYNMAKSFNFESINMDLIAGLPSDTYESFKKSLDKAVLLAPDNITVHTLSIKRSSDLFSENNIKEILKAEETAKMTDYAQKILIENEYNPYYLYRQKNMVGNLENVGYSKAGKESAYNIYIMDEIQTIFACGAGAVTKIVGKGGRPIERFFNYKYHFEYIKDFNEIIKRKRQAEEKYEEMGKMASTYRQNK